MHPSSRSVSVADVILDKTESLPKQILLLLLLLLMLRRRREALDDRRHIPSARSA